MNRIRILIADDDSIFCKLTGNLLRDEGYIVHSASDIDEAQEVLDKYSFDIVMQDMCFPALQDGFTMLEELHERYPELPVLMISGAGHIPDAVNAIKYGATDFIEKPLAKEHLIIRLERLKDSILMRRNLRGLQLSSIGMIGSSEPMQQVFDAIIKAARFDNPVLICGETGVGKELAAAAIHRLSDFNTKNMVTINCASIPRELFEAELFGYEKGAFTGAISSHKGYFEYAQGSSIFLDEIAELPMEVQAKLLRVISEQEIQTLGGNPHKVSTRIISASNKNLISMIDNGSFRDDLYYRISTITIDIPPLRKHRDDIILLADYFVNSFCTRHNIAPKIITPSAAAWLYEQDYPGNVRELKNWVERAVVFSQSETLTVVDFTTEYPELDDIPTTYRETVRQFERNYLEKILLIHDGSITRAANYLQMDKSNLSKKINSLGIEIQSK
ncbi:MAG: sigma-54 dependent transcriptional regulator [Candidatus Cloacimonadales bacterium]|jgi:DNA-binding NtrC family response regulator|nr:sigma-54 dependent transcriptional regulator [Candidatus Cloacimonadota bacterium]MDY0381069.1 sigma-54 dependent transcriptional regulator [Candidatus Cloacimonadaceae bacterium]HCM16157.1 response regulator [Candidatus Cloacimonas sp.]MCB5257441.1 sigma-54 dependent transcriptional regulator [Candidatus Cloacimonadota bacterium]MCB5276721.1 sigma-54 dependent transcriptional regulator [Candidatus Cloacimonadota bacterium]